MARAEALRVVRDDPVGTIRWSLRLHLQDARDLRAEGETLTQSSEFDQWHLRRVDWRAQTAVTLRDHFELETLAEFLRATARSAAGNGDWRQAVGEDLRGMANAIELLAALESTLDGRGGPKR